MPSPVYPIVFTIHDEFLDVVDDDALAPLAARVLKGEGASAFTMLTVFMTGDDDMRDLNQRYLGIDAPTDVLAFPDADFPPYGESINLGDIIIGVPVAMRQAAELGHSLDLEFAHLLVHGILHLCGYEHEEGGEKAARMRAREEFYLGDITSHAEADAQGA